MPRSAAPLTLDSLYAALPAANPAPSREVVGGSALPEPFASLLVHDQHMTEVMERRHGAPIRVEVLERLRTEESYARRIRLRRPSDDAIVQGGLVRIRLSLLPQDLASAILKEQTPLGRLLVDHHTLRRIEILSYFRFPRQAALEAWLGPLPAEGTYGRPGWLHVDGKPAIEVFEVIAPASFH